MAVLVIGYFSVLNWRHIAQYPYLNMWDDAVYGVKSLRGVDAFLQTGSISAFIAEIPKYFPPMVFISNGIAAATFGRSVLSFRIIHTLWFALFLWGCYRVGRKLGNYSTGILSAALSGSALYINSGMVLMEPSLMAAISCSVYYLLKMDRERSVKNSLIFSIFLAIGALSKTTFIPVIGVACLVFLIIDWLDNRDRKILFLAGLTVFVCFALVSFWYIPNMGTMFEYARKSRYWAPHSLGPVWELGTFGKYFVRIYGAVGPYMSCAVVLSLFLFVSRVLKGLRESGLVKTLIANKEGVFILVSASVSFAPLLVSDNKNVRFIIPVLILVLFLTVLVFHNTKKERKRVLSLVFSVLFLLQIFTVTAKSFKIEPTPHHALNDVVYTLDALSKKYGKTNFWYMGESSSCNKLLLQFEALSKKSKVYFPSLCPSWETSIDNVKGRFDKVNFFLYVNNPTPAGTKHTALQELTLRSLPKRLKLIKQWKDSISKDHFYLYSDKI